MTTCDICEQLCNGLGPYCDDCRRENEEMFDAEDDKFFEDIE